jgi:hypothetical protein
MFSRSFRTFDDAVAARKAAERRFGFHPNHGRKARSIFNLAA